MLAFKRACDVECFCRSQCMRMHAPGAEHMLPFLGCAFSRCLVVCCCSGRWGDLLQQERQLAGYVCQISQLCTVTAACQPFQQKPGVLGTVAVGGVQGMDVASGAVCFRCSNAFGVCQEGCTRSGSLWDCGAVQIAYAMALCSSC
jgi:hypothetical protein